MSQQFHQILQQAFLLSSQEQLVLISSLSQYLSEKHLDLDEKGLHLEERDEILLKERMNEVESGLVELQPWKVALAEIKKRNSL